MADFTHTFSMSIVTDDARTIQITHTDTLEEIEQVLRGYGNKEMDGYIYGPTSAAAPQLDAEPILMMFQSIGEGASISIQNTNADVAAFDLVQRQVFALHGTETFELTANVADTALVETLDEIDFTNTGANSNIAYFILLGPTS